MSDEVLIFTNPIAGRGRGKVIAERLLTTLSREGFKPRAIYTPADQVHDEHLPKDACAAIAIGGDGTVRGVARRLFRTLGENAPPILVVSMGTANLLGRHLGLLWTHHELIERISRLVRARRTTMLDVATANGELFLLVAGVGMDGAIVHELDKMRSGPIDYTSYALPAALALGTYAYPPITVTVDGQRVFDNEAGMAFVGNVKEYGTGFPLLPHARPDDGLLDVCVLPCSSRAEALRQLLFAAAGEHLQAEGTVYAQGKKIRVESPQPIPVQVDGEAAGHTPVNIDLLPVRLPFIVATAT